MTIVSLPELYQLLLSRTRSETNSVRRYFQSMATAAKKPDERDRFAATATKLAAIERAIAEALETT